VQVSAQFTLKQAQSVMVPKVYALSRIYLDVSDTLDVSHCYTKNCALGALRTQLIWGWGE